MIAFKTAMKLSLLGVLAHAGLASMAPAGDTQSSPPRQHNLPVVKTTVTERGQTLDWVPVEAQGVKIASPPPMSLLKRAPTAEDIALAHAMAPKEVGPAGTVPILRTSGPAKPLKKLPGTQDSSRRHLSQRDTYGGKHWYASTAQGVNNIGGTATYSVFKAFVEQPTDFSLLQVAVVRNKAAHAGNTGPFTQTVEAGWINYPSQVQSPHLFSYYTTDGYTGNGDGVGGWNRDVGGWVQTDRTIYPGVPLGPLSTIGGDKYEADIAYYLYQGNWWLAVLGRYIGYYPADMFSQGGVKPEDTLTSYADQINFYGEVYNSENDHITHTDMGSGEFPEQGFGRAAYLRRVAYYTTDSHVVDYDGSAGIIVSDTSRYRLNTTFRSGTTWGSYFYLGGPGAGGVVGG